MIGKDFINKLLLKKDFDFSDKEELLINSDEEIEFKDFNNKELKIFNEEYEGYVKAPFVLYYLLNKEEWLKNKDIGVIDSFISMNQIKSDKTNWLPEPDEKVCFQMLGSSKKVLGTGILSPEKNFDYKDSHNISSKKIIEFLKIHPGYCVRLDYSISKDEFTDEELNMIKKLENI